ncbi:MAG: NAD(P)H-dependent oxidoreductase [Bryobacteraceae bacterium]|nr:NAD(P)H-dependent oxidoreductase [Bryobacteraceae bacterium]
MHHLLHIDASPRGERSHSRQLSREFVTAWKTRNPNDVVTYRDLGREPVPPVSESWIGAVYSSPEQHNPAQREAIAISDALVSELHMADIYVFGVPMYNFNVPAPFKAYIDQIVRPGHTVVFDPAAGPRGLLSGKKMFVLTARGLSGYGPGEAAESINFQDPYLRAIFGYIGVTDITFIHGNDTLNSERWESSFAKARTAIHDTVLRSSV